MAVAGHARSDTHGRGARRRPFRGCAGHQERDVHVCAASTAPFRAAGWPVESCHPGWSCRPVAPVRRAGHDRCVTQRASARTTPFRRTGHHSSVTQAPGARPPPFSERDGASTWLLPTMHVPRPALLFACRASVALSPNRGMPGRPLFERGGQMCGDLQGRGASALTFSRSSRPTSRCHPPRWRRSLRFQSGIGGQ